MCAILLSSAVLVACGETASFTCSDDASCGVSGRCEPNGSCSFPDETCPSGRRFGEHAPLDIADHCVDEELAGTTTSGPAMTASTATVESGAVTSDETTTPAETTFAATTDNDTATTGSETTTSTMSSTSSVDGSSSTKTHRSRS